MTKKLSLFVSCLFVLVTMFDLKAQTQDGTHFLHKETYQAYPTTSRSINLPVISADQQKKVKSAVLIIKVKTGTFHQFSDLSFSYTVNFNIAPSSWFNESSYSLTVTDNKPQAVIVRNITSYADENGVFKNGASSVTTIGLSGIAVSGPATVDGIELRDSIQIELEYDIEYGIDIRKETSPLTLTDDPDSLSLTNSGKTYIFSWDNSGYAYPNYEFQLLRLYNVSDDSVTDEKLIVANPDWSKALTMETQSQETSLALAMAEGQGYYLWRVRPIGTYYAGGIANDKNYSEEQWSVHQAPGVFNVTPTYDAANVHCFFFTDPDDQINNIHSRIFTEEKRIKENITYANSLQQVKQTQTYLPSKDTTLVMQSIQDNSGRSAVNTIPVPVDGSLDGYKQGFVKSEETGNLYTADDFDKDANYQNPSKIRQSGTDFQYYSDSNPDKQIPDAEGYPFTRVLFYDDGTNRVKEQSGIGRMHMIGDSLPGHGGGKTVKTFYSTPSETELVRLFGDEAPDNESVIKTITIDQNNTASVTYTSKEGHVIATSLVIQADDNSGTGQTFDTLGYEPSAFEVTDTIRTRQVTPSEMISSKRLVFMGPTDVKLDYLINCKTLEEQCARLTVDCGFEVKVAIHSLDNPALDTVLTQTALSGSCIDGVKTVTWPELTLPAGTYIVEKHLLTTSDPELKLEDARDKIEGRIKPLTSMIKGWLADASCAEMIDTFYIKLKILAKDLADTTSSTRLSNAELDIKYGEEMGLDTAFFTSAHTLNITYLADSLPYEAHITSPCCDLTIPVEYFPLYKCDSVALHDWNEDDSLEVNLDYFENPDTSEFTPDLEGYAVQILLTCPNITSGQAALDTLQKYMNGWRPGELNLMVNKMLTHRYTCEGYRVKDSVIVATNSNNPKAHDEELCGDTVTVDPDCDVNGCIQYTCKDLFECWIAQVTALRETICINSLENVNGDSPYNPSDKFDGENQGDQSKHDDHFDDNVKGNFIVKWLVKKKVSKRMRDLTLDPGGSAAPAVPVSFKKHLVNEFLQCTGYRFAKIIIPSDPRPFDSDTSIAFDYQVPSLDIDSPDIKDRNYMPDGDWVAYSVVDLNPDGTPKSGAQNLFPNIKDPVYAFKYYEYSENHPELEFSVCFDDPNECWDVVNNIKVPCCAVISGSGYDYSFCDTARIDMYPNIAEVKDGNDGEDYKFIVEEFCDFGKVACPITHEDWTCGQRFAFYEMLRSFVSAPDSFYAEEVVTCESLTTGDPSEVEKQMTTMTTGCKDVCDSRRWEFEIALRELLNRKCYTIGPCRDASSDHIIPQEDFNAMVDSMVSLCKGQCSITTFSCVNNECRLYTESKYNLGKTMVSGVPIGRLKLELGVGGAPGECSSGDCSSDPTHSYCELTKYKQAISWHFEIDIDSQCNEEEVITCTDTEVDCPPAANTNPDLQTLGKMADPFDKKEVVEMRESNSINIEVQVGP